VNGEECILKFSTWRAAVVTVAVTAVEISRVTLARQLGVMNEIG
jgi:hypothetical protein